MRKLLELVCLPDVVLAAQDKADVQVQGFREYKHLLLDLKCKFSGWGQNEGENSVGILGDFLDNRYAESCSFA